MILKQVVHDENTNSVECTWVDICNKPVRCHNYADVQMDMLEADLGDNLPEYVDLIATVRTGIKPHVEPGLSPAEELAQLDARNTLTQRNLRDFILLATEALKLGTPVDLSVLPGVRMVAEVEAQAAALRAKL